MPYRIRLLENPTYMEATYYGSITPAELVDAAKELLGQMTRHGTNTLLADCSEVTDGHSAFDLYALADWLSAFAPQIKEAVILPLFPLSSENARFWETTCRNRGLQVCIFNDRQEALTWLLH